jgi:hypothetical protein
MRSYPEINPDSDRRPGHNSSKQLSIRFRVEKFRENCAIIAVVGQLG